MDISIRTPSVGDGGAIARAHVRAWKTAYAGIMPADFLDSIDEDDRSLAWEQRLRDRAAQPNNLRTELLVADVGITIPGPGGRGHEIAAREIVGVATVGPERDVDGSDRGELWMINVRPDVWGVGVGPALLTASRGRLDALGYRTSVLWVVAGNMRARRFYEREGWSFDGTEKDEDFGGVNVHELRYTIS